MPSSHSAKRKLDFVTRAESLAALIKSEAVTTEATGTITAPVIDALKSTELFWMAVPKEVSGGGANLLEVIEVIEELSRADGSTGWAAMANILATATASALLCDEAINVMFSGAQRAIVAGMFAPVGKAIAAEGGFRLSGRFSFASGSGHANWIGAGAQVHRDGRPALLADGRPEGIFAFLPRENVQFRGNWDVMGLEGTGSYDYEVPEQVVDSRYTTSYLAEEPKRGGGMFRMGTLAFGCAGHTGVALGIVKGALEEIAGIAMKKTRAMSKSKIAEHPVFASEFAYYEACYQALRRYSLGVFEEASDAAVREGNLTNLHLARLRQSTSCLHKVGAEIVRFCHVWSGSAALRNPSRLGRCTRDILAATQHVFVEPSTFADAAPPLLEAWCNRVGMSGAHDKH